MRSNLLNNIRQITLSPELRKSRLLRFAIYAVIAVLLYLLFIGNVLPERFDYSVGSIAEKTIKAPIDAVDTRATERAREAARKSIPKQYTKDQDVEDRSYEDIDKFMEIVTRIHSEAGLTREDKLARLTTDNKQISIPKEALEQIVDLPLSTLPTVKKEATRIVQNLYEDEMTDTTGLDQKLDAQLVMVDLDRNGRMVLRAIVHAVIRPNMVYNHELTMKLREEQAASTPAFQINKGEVIVKQGESIDEETLSKLEDLRLLQNEPNYLMQLGFVGFVAIWTAALALYLEMTNSKIGRNNLLLLCLGIVIFVTALGIKTVSIGEPLGFANIGYLTPVAMGTILVTILFDTQLAILLSFMLALLTGAAFDFNFQYIFVAFISSLVGAFAVSRVKHRLVIMRAGFIVAGVNLLTITATQALLSSTGSEFSQYLESLTFGIVNGLFCAIIAIGILPFLESSFGILTPISLLELSNPNHPLLKKLLMEAPGTYHHSLIVGNLAEAAAEMVGADALICRVGAFFHDVGKMKRPLFFIENQMSKDNPHDKIAPSLSHLIITSHVRDGLEMQEEYRLPKPIRDICEQHHGTTVLMYFYNKALEQDKSGTINIDDFRYAGPKPQTKEAAIVMLCDAVEAAVRAMNRPTPNRIESVISKIIKDRLNDGQLDECDLTLKDLDKISDAFLRTLNGIYHARIEYPEPQKVN